MYLWKEISSKSYSSAILVPSYNACKSHGDLSAVSSERFSFNVAYVLKITAIRKCQLLLTRTKITICIFIAFPFPKAIKEIPLCFFLHLTSERLFSSVQFSSVAQLCLTLCDPMNCSTPGLPVHHQLLEFTQTHVHRVGDAIQPSHPLSSPFPPAPNPSQHQSFPMSQLFT